ncbi:hypothetical protein JRO89_XS03G0016700 [Xanthoceras sorbifolium]|uniref:NAC domain-containing protein n=1 Tax=Xanthoceras sorbifolium TaxID=99658 RepID=A0ABQ8I8K2_9ROSI|nr:hypothetical protein JRO89_XS03G0016700 [Xanthoceras sorbifolium]
MLEAQASAAPSIKGDCAQAEVQQSNQSKDCSMMMPTGFRFNPTDEELIEILERKVSGQEMHVHAHFIVQRNVYDHDPRHLQCIYASCVVYILMCFYFFFHFMLINNISIGDNTVLVANNERYCYCIKEDDSREVAGQGWWKATGHLKNIYAYDSERVEWRLCKIKHNGKPSAQEELENFRTQIIRNCDTEPGNSSMSTQPDFAGGVNQAMDHNYNHSMQVMDHDQQTVLQVMGTNSYINGDYQQPEDPSEEPFSCLWSWQN